MKLWTTTGTGRRILHAQLGRWKLSARRGRFRLGWERQAPGAYVVSAGFLFITALRQNKLVVRTAPVSRRRGVRDTCQCATGQCGHRSDCAVHNEPAEPNGPCDCGAFEVEP